MNRQFDETLSLTPREEDVLHSIIEACKEIAALARNPPASDVTRVLDFATARLFSIEDGFYHQGTEYLDGSGAGDKSVVVDSAPLRNIPDLRARLRRFNRKCDGLGLVVIDSPQKLREVICAADFEISEDSMIRTIGALAAELSVPILLLSPPGNER